MNEQPKRNREPKPQAEVLEWCDANCHLPSEVDRSWVWLIGDLRGDNNEELRERLLQYGFRFKKKGHACPSGAVAHWAHSCETPIPGWRLNKGKGAPPNDDLQRRQQESKNEIEMLLASM